MAVFPPLTGLSFESRMLRSSAAGRRALVVASSSSPQLAHALAQQSAATQQHLPSAQPRVIEITPEQRSQALHASSPPPRPAPVLSSITSASAASAAAAAAAADSSLPTAFARALVGAALALSTVYALLSSPASNLASSFSPTSPSKPASADADPSSTTSATTTTTTASAATASPSTSALPILRTPEQFDAFILAANRAGYLAIVLFHTPWCAASQRMERETQNLSHMFVGRRVVFARVDCSIQQGVRPGQPLGQAPGRGFSLRRCDLTQLHRIHKTPTMRMYYNNTCVDEITGCRPVDFRQAASDMTFKYNL
ncbi:hypothetical protein PLESTB_001669000 [Pleodorina starrii]|uniref:Thioredoxin domain-containing protein n=1 Tax=Pleodorina starrii TaxID=330485 RepID=A0A9W6C0A1_9CHLO|nr:hypothetical protein PLESTM_000625700 [Pleodorina starrii]GLC60771.1 hypothetical protein PLESTB_001669000 [Pleodorina starrii]GLC75490.1 hypothetical protein PLESTF_001643400 [Pleodorina starrii]